MPNSTAKIKFQLGSTARLRKSDAPPLVPASGTGRLPRITEVLALAIQFQDLIQMGVARNYTDIARLGCLSRERVSQVMKLVWLAPDIQHEILEFNLTHMTRFPISESAVRRVAGALSWKEQRAQWRSLLAIRKM
jgi:hypothetical protein